MLALYRAGLALRRASAVGGRRDAATGSRPATSVLAFARGDGFVCLVNFGPDPVALPAGADVLIASNELDGGALPQDTTVWLRQATGQAPSGTVTRPDHRIG